MQYSCGYFTDPNNSLDQARFDKLDMICKKTSPETRREISRYRLWLGRSGLPRSTALRCPGARRYALAKAIRFRHAKIKRLGQQDQITIELKDYEQLEGCFDKISSVGMFEHIGIANMERYFKKINSLLRDRGILMNHGISRHAKTTKKAARKIRPERRLLLKYIFPGSELDSVGHTIDMMEFSGFEAHDIWRRGGNITRSPVSTGIAN